LYAKGSETPKFKLINGERTRRGPWAGVDTVARE
jgi:hypothetical protein